MNNKLLIIIAHPDRKRSLTCKIGLSVIDNIQKNYSLKTDIVDLYNYKIPLYKGGKQISEVLEPIVKKLNNYDIFLFVYPTWWSNMPAVLKNFFDWSVLFAVDYDFKSVPKPKYKNKKAIIITSCGDNNYTNQEKVEMTGLITENILRHWRIEDIESLVITGAYNITDNQINKNISKAEKKIKKVLNI